MKVSPHAILFTLAMAVIGLDQCESAPKTNGVPPPSMHDIAGTPLEPQALTPTQAAYVRGIDPHHLADVDSLRVRAIVEICGATPGATRDSCLLDFWSASDEELDAALDEYREMSGGAE